METLKVSSNSNPKAVAGAIASVIRKDESAEIVTIGAGAVNQAVKSICIARGFVASNDMDLICTPSFFQTDVHGETKTSIKLLVEKR